MAVLTLLNISHTPLLCRYITCITFDLLTSCRVLLMSTNFKAFTFDTSTWSKVYGNVYTMIVLCCDTSVGILSCNM